MTDMWWATTSCSSRAIRARSSSSVRRVRSSSVTVRVLTTCWRSSRQARTAAAEIRITPQKTATGAGSPGSVPVSTVRTTATAKVTSHISMASRGRVRSTTRTITMTWVAKAPVEKRLAYGEADSANAPTANAANDSQ